jgi:hypothetical protein
MVQRALVLCALTGLFGIFLPQEGTVVREVERLKIPPKLRPRQGKVLFLLRAEGVQIYHGEAKDGKLLWVLTGPSAVLMDYDSGQKIGTHARGPVWQATDGSSVRGKVIATEPAPNQSAVPWLLLEAKGDGGDGRFGKVTAIARVDTWAGRAPTTRPDKVGAVREVRYQATYVFYGTT